MTKFIQIHDCESGELILINANAIEAVYNDLRGRTYILVDSDKRRNWGYGACESVEEIAAMLSENN